MVNQGTYSFSCTEQGSGKAVYFTHLGKGQVPCVKCSRSFYDATCLFDVITARLGITEDLKHCFHEIYKQILSGKLMILENLEAFNFSKNVFWTRVTFFIKLIIGFLLN